MTNWYVPEDDKLRIRRTLRDLRPRAHTGVTERRSTLRNPFRDIDRSGTIDPFEQRRGPISPFPTAADRRQAVPLREGGGGLDLGDIGLGALRGYERARQGTLGFMTGGSPAESLERGIAGVRGEEQFSGEDLGFVRHLPEDSRVRRAAGVVGEELVDPLNVAAAALGGPAALAALRGAGRFGRGAAAVAEPVLTGPFTTRLLGEAAAGVGARAGSELAASGAERLGATPTQQTIAAVLGGLAGGISGVQGVRATRRTLAGVNQAVVDNALREAAPEAFQLGRGQFEDVAFGSRGELVLPGAERAFFTDQGALRGATLVGGAETPFDSAVDRLRQLLNEEATIRRMGIANREISQGRARQAGGVGSALDDLAEGATLEEAAGAALGGARTGPLRSTFAEPLQLTSDENAAMVAHILNMRRAGDLTEFEALNSTITLNRLLTEGGQQLQPAQRRLLSRIIGEDLVEQLERRPRSAAAQARAEAREILRERQRLDRLAERAQAAAIRAQERQAARDIDARIRELGGAVEGRGSIELRAELQRQHNETFTAVSRAEEAELDSLRRWNERAAEPRPQTAAERRSLAAAQSATERFLNRNPNPDMVRQRVLDFAAQRAAESDVDPAVVGAILAHQNEINRVILDKISTDAPDLIGLLAMQAAGNTADSWVNAAMTRRAILRGVLTEAGLDERTASRISLDLFNVELARRYPDGVPQRINDAIASAKGLTYERATGAIDTFIQRSKNSMFGLDLGVWGQQVLGSTVGGGGFPAIAGAVNRTLAALHLPHVSMELGDSALDRNMRYMLDGLHAGIGPAAARPTEGSLMQYFGRVGRAIDEPYIRITDQLTDWQFRTVLGGLRTLEYEGNLVMLRALGRDITDPAVRAMAADNANHLTFFARSALQASRRTLERATFISPAMTRARIAQLVDMSNLIRPGAPVEQRIMAASMITSAVTGTLAVGLLIHNEIGVGDFEFDPSKPGFGTITTADRRVIDFIPQDNMKRAFSQSVRALMEDDPQAVLGAWERALLGSSTIIPRTIAEQLGVAAYVPGVGWRYGEDIPSQGPLDSAIRAAPLPPIVQNIVMGDTDLLAAGLESFGFSNYPESAISFAERVAAEQLGQPPETTTERAQALAEAGVLEEAEDRRRAELEERAARNDRTAQALLIGFDEREELTRIANDASDKKNYRQRRNRVRTRFRGMRAAYQDVWDSFGESDDPIERLLDQWYSLFEAASTGTELDSDEFERLESAFMNEIGTDNFARIMERVNAPDPRDNPWEAELTQVRTQLDASGFFDIRDRVWQSVAERYGLEAYGSKFELEEEVRRRVRAGLQERGVNPDSRQGQEVLASVVNNLEALDVFDRVFEDVREGWIVANEDLAEQAVEWGYLGRTTVGGALEEANAVEVGQ